MPDEVALVAGRDYPRSFTEFDRFFADEEACRQFLRRVRWPGGFECPRCASAAGGWSTARDYVHCRVTRAALPSPAATSGLHARDVIQGPRGWRRGGDATEGAQTHNIL